MNKAKDIAYLQMCYGLAEKAIGWASPNPYVGAVIVKNDVVVGYGYHEKPGKLHAEAVALQRADKLALNSSVYITLEPCTHWGRTPPCIDKILQAKPKRLVISAYDPNPQINKKGVRQLREAGISVSVGLIKEKNDRLNENYIKHITKKVPFVIIKSALSLDGKTATASMDSQWISSRATRDYIHLLRGEFDAIMVGINTILKDDPRLTVRHPNWKGKKTTRIILDSQLRFPLKSRIQETLSSGRIMIFTCKNASPRKAETLRKKGIDIFPLRSSSRVKIQEVLEWLGKNDISSVFVEGGAALQTNILEERLADKIMLTISPKLIGGRNAPTFFQGKGAKLIKDALRLKRSRIFQIENDMIIEGYF